mmetsp:Transcript_6919/g.19465  ORF Transcript_6919/g.19465 Transcript_6919/m.19465 type:complete len:1191 (+) Transcript_6919:130-3702(+)
MTAGPGGAEAEAEQHSTKAYNAERQIVGSGVCLALALALGVGILVAGLQGFGKRRHPTLESHPVQVEKKPQSDSRGYQFARLSNGLEVVSVHDPRASADAFAIAVDAGSLDDPSHLLGLAHFCEHMLFLGTDSYPDPMGFDQFVNGHGGKTNAYTSDQVTVYYMELAEGKFDESLDRLGDFLRAPRFDESLVLKELHAIDSEHAKNRENPGSRIAAVLDSLANDYSPVSRFHTGSMDTLYVRPREIGIDLVHALRSWFDTHYCPSRTHLVTFSALPLDRQLAKAEQHFGNITARSALCEGPPKSWAEPAAWPPGRRGQWVTIAGKQPKVDLVLSFAFPDLTNSYRGQPTLYLQHILTYGGENSLLMVLRDNLGLINSIAADFTTSSAGGTFMVQFGLAQLGAKQPERVLDVFFGYIADALAQQVNDDLYESIAAVRKLSWDWMELSSPETAVSDLAERLTRLPPEDLLSGDSLVETLDIELVTALLGLMLPENMLAAYIAPGNLTSRRDLGVVRRLAHYGVEFAVIPLPDRFPEGVMRWDRWLGASFKGAEQDELTSLLKNVTGNISAEVVLPELPRAITGVPAKVNTDLMKSNTTEQAKFGEFDSVVCGPRPEKLLMTNDTVQAAGNSTGVMQNRSKTVRAWYRQGWVTNSPKVRLKAAFRPWTTPDMWERSAVDTVRMRLYTTLVKRELESKLYDQTLAGATYDISMSTDGLLLDFDGFPSLLDDLISGVLRGVTSKIQPSQAQLEHALHDLNESLRSYSDMPVTYAVQDRNLLLMANVHSKEDGLQALGDINMDRATSAAADLLWGSPLQLTALVMGNVGEDRARRSVDTVRAQVRGQGASGRPDFGAQAASEVLRVAPVVQVAQPVELRKRNPRTGDPNDALVLSLVWGISSVESRVVLGLLGGMLGQVAFNELRTQQQLGYVVNAGDIMISNVHAMSVAVQGSAQSADAMETAVEQVLFQTMPAFLDGLDDAAFQSFRHGFRQQLLQHPNGHNEEFEHFWGPLMLNESCIGLRDEMLWFLEEQLNTKALLVDTWSQLVLAKNGTRQKIAVKYFAQEPPPRQSLDESMSGFRRSGIPHMGLAQLEREFLATQVLTSADSATRASVGKVGYYPMSIDCEIPPERHSKLKPKKILQDKHTDAIADDDAEVDARPQTGGATGALPEEALAAVTPPRHARRAGDAFLSPG